MMLVVMVAIVVAAAIPAVAQSNSSSIGGDHNNGCFPVMQILWDGPEITNEVEITQNDAVADDIESAAQVLSSEDTNETDCGQENNSSEVSK
jgi:hypothetical protein